AGDDQQHPGAAHRPDRQRADPGQPAVQRGQPAQSGQLAEPARHPGAARAVGGWVKRRPDAKKGGRGLCGAASGLNAGLVASVTLRRQVNGGAWTTVRQAVYTYYDGTQPFGNQGDLQLATILDGAGNVLDTKYYRYYTP